jgi:hypothetical protein
MQLRETTCVFIVHVTAGLLGANRSGLSAPCSPCIFVEILADDDNVLRHCFMKDFINVDPTSLLRLVQGKS